MDCLISIGKVSKLLGVSCNTLRRWDADGTLVPEKTPGKHRKYLLSNIKKIQGTLQEDNKVSEAVCCYCRVSSNDQKQNGDLERQKLRVLEYCAIKGYKVEHILEDCCSGMKYNRPKLDKLYQMVVERKINKVVIEYKDRLCRFGIECLTVFFNSYGVNIECVEEVLPKSFEAELVEDVMSLMTSFTARLHSKRKRQSREYRKKNNIL